MRCISFTERGSRSGTRFNRYLTQSDVYSAYPLSCTEARMGQPAMRLKAHVCSLS